MIKTVSITASEDIRPTESATAESRSRVYSLLSALLIKEVTPDLLTTLTCGEVAEAFKELDLEIGRILDGPRPSDLLDDLAEEYSALFLVPGGISPYASARLHGMLNQKPAWMAEEFYRRCGLAVREECRILPDHLGMELEFMGYLARKEADARFNQDEKAAARWLGLQSQFFQEHIDRWAFGFLEDLRRYAVHPFYREVSSLTTRFLEVEKEHLTPGKRGEEDTLSGDETRCVQKRKEETYE